MQPQAWLAMRSGSGACVGVAEGVDTSMLIRLAPMNTICGGGCQTNRAALNIFFRRQVAMILRQLVKEYAHTVQTAQTHA